ncbi:MAG: hypothetical protein HY673_22300 [Chloroflexi bacterium]|nr:hypothetical protein [Chloroflexota bacterium]
MAMYRGGYTGRILRVDLTNEQITEEHLSQEILNDFVGGAGLGAKVLYDEVPPGVEWNDPRNRLILATGPLNGLKVAGAGSFCVVTKGPLTNGGASSQANGYFGAYLKFSGYDAVIIQGSARRWLYLYVHDGIAELRDAGFLVGRDTVENEQLIKKELGKGERHLSVFGIGPAGENLVKFAAIVGDRGHVAGHNGTGAVMGSKKLKAVAAARGKGDIVVVDKDRVSAVYRQTLSKWKEDPFSDYYWGTSMVFSRFAVEGDLGVRNLTSNTFPEHARFMGDSYREEMELKRSSCWACPAAHCHIVTVKQGPYAGYVAEEPEFEGWETWGSLIGQTDLGAAVMLNDVTDRLGLELNEAGWTIGMVMELYEKGVLGEKDTGGLPMNWGNVEAVRKMLSNIAYRRGLGNVLAEGVMRAARSIGREATESAVFINKGSAPKPHDGRVKWASTLDQATSSTGTFETGTIPVPNPFSPEDVPAILAREKGPRFFVDCLVTCQFPTLTKHSTFVGHLVDMFNATTGGNLSPEEAKKVGLRTANLYRAFNVRHGITPEAESLSPRYLSSPIEGPKKGKGIAPHWESMLDIHYREMGWDRKSGKPLPGTLRNLRLAEVIPDLWS